MRTPLISLACAAVLAPSTSAQLIDFSAVASLDRWMYPFNGSPGTRLNASTFGAPRLEGFDDHDAQFIVGFATGAQIPTGLPLEQYRFASITVRATVSNDRQFRYDPTYDQQNTYESQEGGYPNLVPDSDIGRPVELYPVGYREGYTAATWTETTAFGFNPVVPPAQEARTAFMAIVDTDGNATDASNNLTAEFDLTPMSVGQTDSVAPGDLVPFDTTFTFEIDLCDAATRAYLARGLQSGELRFAIASLHPASGGDTGPTGDPTYPIWYTRENPIAQILGFEPRIEASVRTGPIGDYDNNGTKNIFDILAFIDDYNAQSPLAELTGDCQFNIFDILAFIDAYNAPTP
ncbi:MAG: hypothetical protein D6692_01600 [Planctomycetota bacterium]|nr:MAG: hypothetical protein D6692_01600 [Planctomycetota bacterium]